MNKSTLSSGILCANMIASRELKRDILPNHGEYYRGTREQKDRQRFITFMNSPTATDIYDNLSGSFDTDGFVHDLHPKDGGLG